MAMLIASGRDESQVANNS